jgi:hypothetical protein
VEWSSIAEKVINPFYDKERALTIIGGNLYPRSWTGSPESKFDLSIRLVETLLEHSEPRVKTWARKTKNLLEQSKKKELESLDNMDRGVY